MKNTLVAAFGLLAGFLVTLLFLVTIVVISFEQSPPAPVVPQSPTSSTAHDLAARISPVIIADVSARKDQIIASAGGLPARTAVRAGWPVGIREIPTLTEVGCNAFLDDLGGKSLTDLATTVNNHNRARGRASHPSLLNLGGIGSIGSVGAPAK